MRSSTRSTTQAPAVSVRPFDEVVAEHGQVVLRVCRALVGPLDAEDAWSDTFLAALQAYPRLRPDSNVRGWLVTIAHRKALDHLRAQGRRPRPAGWVAEFGRAGRAAEIGRAAGADAGLENAGPENAGLDNAGPENVGPENVGPENAGLEDAEMRVALEGLPPKQRGAVIYRYLADLAYAEIAELLDCSEAAARRNAADGIAKLRTHYRKEA